VIVQAGLLQINAVVPNVPGGDRPITATAGGVATTGSTYLTIQ
jgi:uncharacterized protein (TIGR03437 family)